MNDTHIVKRCQQGDRAAFTELFRSHHAPAYRFCAGLVGNSSDAVDIVQEAFTAAFQGIGRLDPSRGFSNWFYGILRHLCHATLRQRSRYASTPELVQTVDPSNGPEAIAIDNQRLAAALACLDCLTPIQREVVVLRELEGLSYDEMAQRLAIPIGTVMSRLFEARRALSRTSAPKEVEL